MDCVIIASREIRFLGESFGTKKIKDEDQGLDEKELEWIQFFNMISSAK